MTRPDIKPIAPRKWLSQLGMLTAGATLSEADAQTKILSYLTLLMDEFPPAAFNQASLNHVAKACKFFPSYAEVAQHLSAWHGERKKQKEADDELYQRLVATRIREHALTLQINPDYDISNREDYLRRDWDDPAAILAKVKALEAHTQRKPLIHMLASIVNKHAPQHLGMIPPDILEQWSK
jgi:hypothetical protein